MGQSYSLYAIESGPGLLGTANLCLDFKNIFQSNPDMLDWKLRQKFCVKCRKSSRDSARKCYCGEIQICDGYNLEFILLCWNVRQKIATPETGKFYLDMVKFLKRFGCTFSTPISNSKSAETPYTWVGFQNELYIHQPIRLEIEHKLLYFENLFLADKRYQRKRILER